MNPRVGQMLLILGLVVAGPVIADAQLERTGSARVSFTSFGPAGLTIVGKTSELAVADGKEAVVLTVPLTTLTTGIGVRDRHMRRALEIEKYPKAKLTVNRSDLKIPAPGRQLTADVQGILDLHGQSHPIKFHYTAKRDGKVHEVRSEMRVTMSKWGVVVASYMGMNVKPDVDVSADFSVADK